MGKRNRHQRNRKLLRGKASDVRGAEPKDSANFDKAKRIFQLLPKPMGVHETPASLPRLENALMVLVAFGGMLTHKLQMLREGPMTEIIEVIDPPSVYDATLGLAYELYATGVEQLQTVWQKADISPPILAEAPRYLDTLDAVLRMNVPEKILKETENGPPAQIPADVQAVLDKVSPLFKRFIEGQVADEPINPDRKIDFIARVNALQIVRFLALDLCKP